MSTRAGVSEWFTCSNLVSVPMCTCTESLQNEAMISKAVNAVAVGVLDMHSCTLSPVCGFLQQALVTAMQGIDGCPAVQILWWSVSQCMSKHDVATLINIYIASLLYCLGLYCLRG